MTVKLRQTGNSRTLTLPSGIKVTGAEYTVKNVGKTPASNYVTGWIEV